MIHPFDDREYYGYHKGRLIVGPCSREKKEYWKRIIKLKWGWRVKKDGVQGL